MSEQNSKVIFFCSRDTRMTYRLLSILSISILLNACVVPIPGVNKIAYKGYVTSATDGGRIILVSQTLCEYRTRSQCEDAVVQVMSRSYPGFRVVPNPDDPHRFEIRDEENALVVNHIGSCNWVILDPFESWCPED